MLAARTQRATIRRAAIAAAVAALAGACGPPIPEPLPRILGAAPEGEDVSTAAVAEVRFGAPVDPAGLADGRLLVLAPAEVVRAAIAAVESDAGAVGLSGAVSADVAVEDGGTRVVLRPRAPLRGWTEHAIVLSSHVHAADGRQMLDPDGRNRTFVASFATGAPDGPPPRPAISEVRADAETPEAGGEYVEVVNLGEGSIDLGGWRLAKRTASGALSSCAIVPPAGRVLAPGEVAIVGGGAWDGRYDLPPEVAVMACGASALLGGIANDRGPSILLADPGGHVLATFGEAGAPVCPIAVERVNLEAADEPANLVCTEGTPGLAR
jgi:hypothetical protein